MRHAVAVAVVFLLAAGGLSAATFRTPADAELLGRADVVVVATVLDSVSRETAGRMVYTDYHLRVEDVVKGDIARGPVTVTELGGFANNHGIAVPGAATYAAGTRVLAFLRHRDDGTLFTAYMGLGKYRFVQRDGIEVLMRDADGLEVDDHHAFAARPAREFVQYLRDGAPATAARPRLIEVTSAVEPKQTANNAASYTISGGGRPLRWNCPSACTQEWTVGTTPQAGAANSGLAVSRGMAAWTDEDDAWITLAENGSNSQTGTDNDDVNDIVFNSNETNGFCDAGIGCGIIYFNGGPWSHVFDGSTFNDIVSSDVIVRPGDFGQNLLDAILGHELGHGIGLDHAPTGGALMSGSVPSGATLREYDQEAVAEVYGNGLGCTAPNVTSTSGSGSVFSGNSRTLSVNATGTAPFSYQWYAGSSGNTSSPIGTGNPYTTGPITQNSTFWVRVTNDCGSDDSGDINVTVQSCDAPSISTQPQSVSIAPNSATTLTVGVTGTAPLFVQWYRGQTGNTTQPVGTGNSYTTPNLNTTTSYWARVTNDCGFDNSETATVTVQPCTAPTVTTQSPTQNIQPNGTATLTVTMGGTSPFTFQWYRGNVGDTANPVGTNSASFTTPALQATTTYWVRITNCGGTINSAAILVNVGPACVPVTFSSLGTHVDVAIGETATLTATTNGTAPISYQWYQGDSGNVSSPVAGATGASLVIGPFQTPGEPHYWVKATNTCGTANSATVVVTSACGSVPVPDISAPPASHYTSPYTVQWTTSKLSRIASFELQEATNPEFTTGLKTFIVTGALAQPINAHTEITTDTRFYYRVRAIPSCTQVPTAYSATASTVVTRPEASNSTGFAISVPQTATSPFTQDYLVPGFGAQASAGDRFSITTDAPWLTVFPASGALAAGGTTVQLTINPALLDIGSTTASVLVTRTQGSGKGIVSNATSNAAVPVSISKVTPVTPAPRSADAPPGTLLIPAIAHADGVNTRFQSDVRIVNASGDPITYDLSYTPSRTSGTETGKRTTLTIGGNDSKGLDDVVKAWYGSGVLNELGLGTLEIRPLNNANPLATFASSRTYAITTGGTLGQFIPAIPLSRFAGSVATDSAARISLQQIANSPSYRTNLGFVEGSGTPVTLRITLRDGSNAIIKQVEKTLPAYGHEQTNFTAVFGEIPLSDGRVEVEVVSPGGKATAYASVVDNQTSDPLMVFPVQAQKVSAQHYVVPGVAEFDNGPSSNFHTDMRIYNADTKPVTIALNYYPQSGDSTPRPANATLTLAAGEVKVVDNALPSLWTLSRTAGAVAVDAPPEAKLVITARTFSRDATGGTYGQFIPGATSTDGVGLGQRSLEVLQLEQSASYRTNLGLVEVTGNPVTVEILARTGTKLTAVITADLAGNEYRQINRIFEALGLSESVYTGRVSVRVVGGNGRVVAYGSVVDNRTVDPTYVPAQ